jgi:hypothetical protein
LNARLPSLALLTTDGRGHAAVAPSRMPHSDRLSALVLGTGLGAALLFAATIALAGAKLTLLLILVLSLLVAVALHPPLGAYILIAVTPLVAGMSRGASVPMLRPNEAIMALVVVALCGRAVFVMTADNRPRLRLTRLDVAIAIVAVTSSVIPLAWLAAQGQHIEKDDVLYALMVWKYYAVFLIFRNAVRTPRELRVCLRLSMAAAALVAVIAIFQSVQRFGVNAFLNKYYAPYENAAGTRAITGRGSSTLSLPIAVADLMVFNLAIAIGLLRESKRRSVLLGLAALFVLGVFAAGEFSGVIGLVIGVVALAVATRRARYLAVLPVSLIAAAVALRPVIDKRLQGFQSTSGLPPSWEGRLYDLKNYFFPQLFSHEHWVLGVRPAARVATQTRAFGYIWIESGYVWLLWAGGVPLLVAFFYFLWAAAKEAVGVLRTRTDAGAAAALAVITGVSVVGVLMILDPHLTYRGSADLLFALLGLTAAASSMPRESSEMR